MPALAFEAHSSGPCATEVRRLTTTLCDLIESIIDEAGTDEQSLVAPIVKDLLEVGRAQWVRKH
jgi:hypothetical protein